MERINTLRLRIFYLWLILFFCFLSPVFCISQTVPSLMMIGDVKLHINESARRQIQQDVDRLTRSNTYYNILVDRMNLYFPIIEREHRKNGIPDEIKFLAIQESALISDAVSTANAVGFWQFKDFTGREVGLRIDRQVDERLNIVSASRGSAKYFKTNNFFFDNWAYAVIAYQAGPGGAKAHTDTKNYGSKKIHVTTKTYWYLKKFIAHVVAFSPALGRPHSEGIWLDEIKNAGGKSLQQIAREQKVDLEEIEKYNKWLKRGKIPEDKTYYVLVPRTGSRPRRTLANNRKEKANKIPEPEKKIYPTEIKPGITKSDRSVIVPLNKIPSILSRETDDVPSISARAGISQKKFRKYNDMTIDQKIIPNEFYYIKKKKGRSKMGFHVTQKDETLWEISQKYGIRLSRLAKKNRINLTGELNPGRVLWLSKTMPKNESIAYHKIDLPEITETGVEKSVVATTKLSNEATMDKIENKETESIVVPVIDNSEERRKVKIHTVTKGESLWAISRLYDVKVDDLLRWNELTDPDAISIGQNIQVKAPIDEAVKDKNVITHKVKPGETLYAISRKYQMTVDELMDLNGMSNFDLNSGQEIKVFAGENQ
ncbi:MAG: LysM peptidoglycan-binding domain-containing protein [Bacteroidota bacterium]